VSVVIVDGYNVIHAWPRLKTLITTAGGEDARRALVAELAEYAAVRNTAVTVVFDGPRRAASAAEVIDGVTVVFSGRSGSADHLIERLVYEAARAGEARDVMVATSDRLQRDLVRAMGVATIDAAGFEAEVAAAGREIGALTERSREQSRFSRRVEQSLPPDVLQRLEQLRRGRGVDADGGEGDGRG